MNGGFTLISEDTRTRARRGRVHAAHGSIETPVFMPVGTQATVKGLQPRDLKDAGAQVILGNTYHLNLRPGSPLIRELGGLHAFMGWNRPILTDSGGFQAFSLSKLRKLDDDGVRFRSHLDGSKIFLGPREVIDIQRDLGSDIAMVLDQCPPAGCPRREAEEAVRRSLAWADTSIRHARETGFLGNHMVFAIVQGGRFEDLRRECAHALAEMNFPGYAIGGVSVGESEEEMMPQVAISTECLPRDKARYVMGVGTPPQLLRMIGHGADMFDCVMPTREARHGVAFTRHGKINLKNHRFRNDPRPLGEGMVNPAGTPFSRAYLRHLVMAGEILGAVLLSLHNVSFFLQLMEEARLHIENGDYHKWSENWIETYQFGDAQRAPG